MKYFVVVLIAICGILATSNVAYGDKSVPVPPSYSSKGTIKIGTFAKDKISEIVADVVKAIGELLLVFVGDKEEVSVKDVLKTIDKLKKAVLKDVLIDIPKLVDLSTEQIVNLIPPKLCEIPVNKNDLKRAINKSLEKNQLKIIFKKLVNIIGKFLTKLLVDFFVDLLNDL